MKRRKLTKKQKELLKRLKEEPVKNLKFEGNFISFKYDGKDIKCRMVVKSHEKWVGSWSRKRPIVYIDDDLKGIDRKAVALHEAVERYITLTYGFGEDEESHDVAMVKEREFLKRRLGDGWRSHQIKIGIIFKREQKWKRRRKRKK
jgi:hypothetical protein